MRVIAGVARGRKLAAPQHGNTRPTPDRVREAVFSALAPLLPGARVLDLFAGSGALGIEALSRGAQAATFVERDAGTAALLRSNLGVLPAEVRAHATVCVDDVGRTLSRLALAGGPFDLVFADAPFAAEALADVLVALVGGRLLAPGGRAVLEHASVRPSPPSPAELTHARTRSYGSVSVSTYVWAA